MKKKFFAMSAAVALLFVGYSCSTDESAPAEKQNQAEVSFAFMEPADIETRTATDQYLDYDPWSEYTQCKTGFAEDGTPIPLAIQPKDLLAHLKIQATGAGTYNTPSFNDYITITQRSNGEWVTQPITLDAGKDYEISDIEIVDKATKQVVYYSGVKADATFAPYVGKTLPQTITGKEIPQFTKPVIDVWVLCARGREPKPFGKPKFDLNRVEVSCIPVFVDVCDNSGEEFVANGTISLQKIEKATEPALSAFNGVAKVKDDLKSGQISYVCFADNLDVPDNQEWYLITIETTNPDYKKSRIFSLDQLKKYKTCPLWNNVYGYIDVLLCDECVNETPINEDFENTSIGDLQTRGWAGFTPDMSVVAGGNPGQYMIILGQENHGTDEYTITTEKFRYTQGEKIFMDLKAKFEKSCFAPSKACVKVEVSLKKSDGSLIPFGETTFPVSECHQDTWATKAVTFPCPQTLATDCYTMQLKITMPGESYTGPITGIEYAWYEVFDFGIDNLKNK